ncbi:MAG TPA: amino acid ABC transporter permease [Ornithinicoccus sp.]|jgi:polar amino acid transport system permease protein|nr:amino acid ABC transporter permease [Ornithinicoccus sp.]
MMSADQPSATAGERPGRIDAVPVRHPWRWVAVGVVLLLAAMFVHMLLTNEAFEWSFVFDVMFRPPVLRGLLIGTLLVTVLAMVIGVGLGVLLAVMRLSPNPVLSTVAFGFVWFFRAVPRLVLLTIMGALGILFQEGLSFGFPFDQQLLGLLGIDGEWRFLTLDPNQVFSGIAGGAIGLGLSEAAYMAEIARAGILSVDRGQTEAAEALGMDRSLTMRRIVLPQAMRVIVPPTGNELISMVKDTSLLVGLPLNTELFFQLQSIGSRTFKVFPVLVAACLWYLIICTVLMIGQYYLERYFNRGYGGRTRAEAPVVSGSGPGGAVAGSALTSGGDGA